MKLTADDKVILSSFIVVFSAFTTVYITQPILPVIEKDFGASPFQSSLSISLVLAGITLGSIPSGVLNEKHPVFILAFCASALLIICTTACAFTSSLSVLVTLRFCQGFLVPFLTSAIAASLSKTVSEKNIVRGIAWYVTATILGGMTGRVIGGTSSHITNWQISFLFSSALIFISCLFIPYLTTNQNNLEKKKASTGTYREIIRDKRIWGSFVCAFFGQGTFSAIFNTLPFRLDSAPYNLSSNSISVIYCVYLIGLLVGPLTGKSTVRFGSRKTLIAGTLILATGIWILTGESLVHVVIGLSSVCVGFFAIHTTAAARLNRLVDQGLGQANSLYMIFYYLGAFWGSSWSILIFEATNWNTVMYLNVALTLVLLVLGREKKDSNQLTPLHPLN